MKPPSEAAPPLPTPLPTPSPSGPPVPTVGVDVGGTNVRAAVVAADGSVVADARAPRPADWGAAVATIADLVRRLRKDDPAAAAVGVGAAGLVDADGTLRYAPNIAGVVGAPIRADLSALLEVPVVVDNDANAAAWGEAVHGAARGARHVLMITLGTGIGGGIIAGGRVYEGAHGFAGEVGHFQVDRHGPRCACGDFGHWETRASGRALGRMGRERAAGGRFPGIVERSGGDPGSITGMLISDAALDGDPDALDLVRDYAAEVAVGFAGLANILDPERIVVSGGLVRLGEVLFGPLRDAFARHLEASELRPRIEVVPAELGEWAGVIGAAAMARELVAPG